MAVKIINLVPKHPKHADCEHCGVELEYMPIDVHEHRGTDYSGSSDGCKWIICPNCKCEVILEIW